MRAKLAEFIAIVQHDPAVDNVVGFTGGSCRQHRPHVRAVEGSRSAQGVSADQVIARLRRKLARMPGATLYLQAVQDIRIGGHATSAQYQYTLHADNLHDLDDWAPQLLERMRTLPDLRDVNTRPAEPRPRKPAW